MKVYHHEIKIETIVGRPSYHDILADLTNVKDISGIKDGILTITTPHTTCSLYFEETMHDTNFFGDEYLQVDFNNVMDKIAPSMKNEGDYHSPGEKHIEFGLNLNDPNYPAEKWVMLNTDAHIRSSIFGSNSMTLIIKDSKLLIGELGRVYFVDWDQLRARTRTINFLVMGNE
ncbi:secondary thiamine-phosphate synthase [Aerococcus urinaehominis]|uniref:Secondary thiamine-phosphate synthase n=1 Tax=Aerococcus urinaehominis TaxID=128944 RepID=A0A0X8FMD4_9LACT|nr:YjbQ family protein [Aerococcus urinaehominis]AMB99897.1 secondary thiamine-phosphate synthase [Aerococcus urinaehominis]SDM52629.1 Thiamin phosphate synthase YjbQ, UPF0047 family [Aerococcus urinaehominis]